jgi:hypothetical protein
MAAILTIFGQISTSNIRSGYTKCMIDEKDEGFAKFLSNYLDNGFIMQWNNNPNNPEILEEVSECGFGFYNYFYIGNYGYDWVEDYMS